MIYNDIIEGVFLERPNRFIARVLIDGKEEMVHVKNTGRCREILKKGTKIYLEKSKNPSRKTKYSLISAYKDNMLINIDSQVPNNVVYEAIKMNKVAELLNIDYLKKEVQYNNSRFDLYYEKGPIKGYIEVKGVTLEDNGTTMFPDAPTTRGTKHINELIETVKEGYKSYIFFLIQINNVKSFKPNQQTDPNFAEALQSAHKLGVNILCYDSQLTKNEIVIGNKVPIEL